MLSTTNHTLLKRQKLTQEQIFIVGCRDIFHNGDWLKMKKYLKLSPQSMEQINRKEVDYLAALEEVKGQNLLNLVSNKIREEIFLARQWYLQYTKFFLQPGPEGLSFSDTDMVRMVICHVLDADYGISVVDYDFLSEHKSAAVAAIDAFIRELQHLTFLKMNYRLSILNLMICRQLLCWKSDR